MNSPVIPSSSRTSSPSSSSSSFWSIRLSSTSSHPPRLYSLSICCRRCYWRGGGVVALDDPPPSPPPPSSRGEGRGGDSNRRSPSQIQVPRQSYIPVSKTDLLDALVFTFNSRRPLDGDDDCNSLVRQFLILSSCLESILHAEHKAILEEMRTDYSLCCPNRRRSGGDGGEPLETFGASNSNDNGSVGSYAEDDPIGTGNQMDFHYRASTAGNWRNSSDGSSTSRVEIATRFQRSFMKLLSDAQFEELSVRDLLLTSALNGDYLLTLPIYVDWKKASESNAVIFRRGYVTEKQKGRLIVEKLDYLQSKLLQGAFSIISKPLRMVGLWISKTLESGEGKSKIQVWLKRIKLWIEETSQALPSYGIQASKMMDDIDNKFGGELPIWLTAQRAVSRYEGLLSSVGPRGRLLRRFLTWTGLIQSSPERSLELSDDIDALEPYLRPVSISRIALADIWRPATSEYCGNDIWRILRNSISIIFSQSVLQEPAFDQLILLYTAGTSKDEARDNIEVPTLQLRIYEKIPIPDLPVIFPNKKLSFRILDTVRLDIATILGLLAYFINYKFEDVLSSPSAVLLDVIAVSTLVIYVTRVALGYKQTWDRYQLLVNKTLYIKTLASGFGSVHFLLDASEQQQYKECILAYAMLLNAENGQAMNMSTLEEKCERFLYNAFEEKVVMPINKVVDTLKKFGLVMEDTINGETVLLVVPFSTAYNALKQQWDCLLS